MAKQNNKDKKENKRTNLSSHEIKKRSGAENTKGTRTGTRPKKDNN